MKIRFLPLKRAQRNALLILLLSIASMANVMAQMVSTQQSFQIPNQEATIEFDITRISVFDERIIFLYNLMNDNRFEVVNSENEGIFLISASDVYEELDLDEAFADFFEQNIRQFAEMDKFVASEIAQQYKESLPDDFVQSMMMDIYIMSRQNNLCANAQQICSDNGLYEFPAGVNAGSGESGPNYACLNTTPNPAWFYFEIGNPGSIDLYMYSTPSHDLDFCCWGPFTNPIAPCPNGLTSNKVVSCSYSASATEHCLIPTTAQSGEIYILVITNYSNQACNISFSKVAGYGSMGCGGPKTVTAIVNPAEGGTVVGTGVYEYGNSCTLAATANEGYVFGYWTDESGMVVSTDEAYTFTVWGNRTFTANFMEESEACYLTFNLYDSGGDGWSWNQLVLNYEDGSYQNLTMPSGTSSSLSFPFTDGSHVSLGWISGAGTDQCSFTVSYSNGNVIDYGYNLNNSFNYEFDVDCAGMPLTTFDVTTEASPTAGGTVSGSGQYAYFTPCTLNASANAGYTFANWTLNGVIVSTDAEYTFEVLEDAVCVAHFVSDGNIVFADANVKSICVTHWDTNGDGELSYAEAASVTDLGSCFQNNSNIIMFNELQYFIGLSAIGDNAFKNCSGLTLISLPSSLNTIGNSAFYGCSSMTGLLTLPDNLTTIRSYAFYNCSGLIGGLTIPDSVISIGDYAFQGCSGFMGFLTIGESVTSIGSYAFSGCSNFTGSINIPNSVITIGIYAFYGCTAFWGTLTIGSSVTTIGNSAFNGCTGLVGDVEIPNSVTSIGPFAFYNCHSFGGNLTIGESVTTIGASAFDNCTGFTGTLTVGNSVASIGYNAFHNCSGFTQVHYNATNCGDVSSPYSANYTPFTGCGGTLTIGDNVERIPNYIFYDASFTGSLTIPSSVTTIGSYAFYNCTGLVGEIVIPNSVTTIGSSAFYNCYGFSGTLTIGNSVTTIGERAFYNCINLVGNIEIPNSVTSIGSSAFYNCNKFSGSLTIPSSVTSIGYEAFYNCYRLSEVNYNVTNHVDLNDNSGYYPPFGNCRGHLNIGDNVVRIPSYMFRNADFSGILTIPNSVISISDGAFKNCNLFTGTLVIPNSLNTIGISAFEDCDGFSEIIMGNNVMIVGNRAFYSCSGLTKVILPEPVTVIGIEAFKDCNYLAEINMQSMQAPSIGWDVFGNNAAGRIINIPCGATENYSVGYWEEWASALNEMCDGYEVIVVVNPSVAGSATGAGTYNYSEMCTLTATGNLGYPFLNWTKNGVVVSTESTYSFGVTESCTCVANFSEEPVSYEITVASSMEEGGIVDGEGNYLHGETVALTATPNEGYSFINWTKNGEVVSTEAFYSFTATEAGEFVANFELNTYEITVEANSEAGGTVTGAGTYDHGATVILTVTVNEGFTFLNWTKDGEVVSTDMTFSFIATETATFVANIQQNSFDITVSANPEAGGVVAGGNTYNYGATCILTATVNEGYTFISWTKDGEVVSTNASFSFIVTEGGEFVANFELNSYDITTSVSPTISGTVTGGGTYDYGTTCTLTATPNTGYHFLNWTKGGSVVSTEVTYSFTVTESSVFVAHFELNAYEITATANPETVGTVTGGGTFEHGSTCTLTATANEGYIFVNWTEGGTEISANATYSFIVTGSRDLVANFIADYHWQVNIHNFESTMTLIGVIQINGMEQTSEELEIGAFSGNECRGRERLTDAYYQAFGHCFVFLTVYGEDDDEISFRLYDRLLDEELDLTCASIVFSNNATYGNPEDPYIFDFGSASITQTTDFAQGWNWWSSYVEGNDLLDQLKTGLGANGQQIKSQTQFTQYNSMLNMWIGQLNSIGNEATYMVQTNNSCTVELNGPEATPESHPVTLNPGWNWIGFPSGTAMPIATTFSNITPANQDQVKSQSGFSQYNSLLNMWVGNLNTIYPGMGLQYKSNASGNVTLVYPAAVRNIELAENITNEDNHWTNDVYAYPNNMTVTAVVELNEVELQSENYEVAAFANGECRGSARLMYVAPLNRYMAFLTIAGDEASELHFGLYDAETGNVETSHGASLQYETNAIVGNAETPYVISFRSTTGIDELGSRINVFPNPVARGENITIGVPSVETLRATSVEIVNTLGQVVETVCTLSAQTITAPSVAGVYTMRITIEGEGTYCRKLVVR